jgi:hypothetical protein
MGLGSRCTRNFGEWSGEEYCVEVEKCALGVIQNRGHKVIDPGVVDLGAHEVDYLARHILKVRETVSSGGRSVFVHAANTPNLLDTLRSTLSDPHFAATAKTLQDSLAYAMRTSTNAKDCVFAAVRAADAANSEPHVTLLKLDAVVEAAQMKQLANHGVSFHVLRKLLPEPGKLQKALPWPDIRASSDVIMLDTNFAAAQYFEIAYQVRVSAKSVDAEEQLIRTLSARLPPSELPQAVQAAAKLSGPLDDVLSTLAADYPALSGAAAEATIDARPAGIVRPNKISARQIVWKADGVEVRVSPGLAASVSKQQTPQGTWELVIETPDEPMQR